MDVKGDNSIETEEDTEDIMELELEEVVDEEEELDSEQLQLPRPTSWTNPETGKTVHGKEVFALKYEFDNRPKNTGRRDEFDFCSICYRVLTSNGTHQICSLPCGHMYGFSCIEAWLKTGRPGSVKCPQCSTACTLKDVRLINATRLHIPDAAASDQNVADEKSSTRRFPYNSAGVKAYRDYESGQLLHASNKRSIDLKRRADVLGKQKVAMKRLTELLNLKAHTEKQAKSLEQRADAMGRADALRCRADALGQWADEYLRKADALRCRADALGQWADEYLRKADAFGWRAKALFQRLEKFDESILFLDNA
ncbi:zinc finger, RING/FYVE/PHD-type [Artemisia annua]|uniref:Zinc finger, RING/FYVE/PHD-type n=1 Tax=Artemisia annua TaxID=35608 RepID=A0A2U1NC64_ARTAN|nr:zinc finger, RING/FYVE/PHD-type [Artemisia annua]